MHTETIDEDEKPAEKQEEKNNRSNKIKKNYKE